MLTVTVAVSPSAMPAPAGSTAMLNAGGSLAAMVIFLLPIGVASIAALIVMVSAGSTSVSSSASTVVVPAVAPVTIVMLRVVIV